MTEAPPLRVRSVPLGDAFDLLVAYPGHGGFFMESRGVGVSTASLVDGVEAASAPADQVGLRTVAARTLARLRASGRDDPDGVPLAVGSVPFDRTGRAAMWIPAHVAQRTRDGRARAIRLDDGDGPSLGKVVPASPADPFGAPQIVAVPSPDAYAASVVSAVDRIRRGELQKVVLARTIEVEAGRVLDPRSLVHRLRAVDPDAFSFAMPTGPGASLVGASPEALVWRNGNHVRSNPMAGSAPRSGDPDEDRASAEALIGSTKDREEHDIVVEAIAETMRPMCIELSWNPEPLLHETANVWHLSTHVRGVLRDPPPSAMELVAELHPTPAVGGTPRDAALAAIGELEPFDRGAYAGAIGWMDANGDGEWALALRCAELKDDRATLYAGAGIVAGSEPGGEIDETERKFRAFLDAMRWG